MIHHFTHNHMDETVELDPDIVSAICHSCLVRASSPENPLETCMTLIH